MTKAMRKHTCGLDGDPGPVTPLDGTCQACIEESRQERKGSHIVNPVCSKCGKSMIEPLPGESYQCNNPNCPGKLSAIPKCPYCNQDMCWVDGEGYRCVMKDCPRQAELQKPIHHPVETIDNQRFLDVCNRLAAELDTALQNLSGPASKKTIEYCLKIVHQMIEGLRGGQESNEARERYKDRLTQVAATLIKTGSDYGQALNTAVNVVDFVDKHCEERNRR